MRKTLACIVIGAATPLLAATDAEIERRYTRTYDQCLNSGEAAQGITPAMRACVSAEIARQDIRLNQTYGAVMARQTPAGKIRLRNLERIWVVQRDRKCRAETAEFQGGTMGPQMFMGCQLDRFAENLNRGIPLCAET
jgi:uncharacterized protein YecT (DUF1311 family)